MSFDYVDNSIRPKEHIYSFYFAGEKIEAQHGKVTAPGHTASK